MPVVYAVGGGKCATPRAVFSCNGGRFALQYAPYCNAKRHVLESKTGRIAVCFVCFYYQNHDFWLCGLCFLTFQICRPYLVCQFPAHVFLYNIVYKTDAGWTGRHPDSVSEYCGTHRHPVHRAAAESSFCCPVGDSTPAGFSDCRFVFLLCGSIALVRFPSQSLWDLIRHNLSFSVRIKGKIRIFA